MSYKSNRNYTLPPLNLALTQNPKYPLQTSQATGLCSSGYTYYVTYAATSNPVYTANKSFGYPITLPCAYVQSITGQYDPYGNPTYLSANFPNNSFPYLRNSTNMSATTFSGTGWNTNQVQLMVNVVNNNSSLNYDTIPTNGWQLISSGVGNGIYTGDTTDSTIDPLKLSAYQFIISAQDYASGSTYTMDPTFYTNSNIGNDGLFFGNESFFFGNISTGIQATAYKSVITLYATNTNFNSTNNPTFNINTDNNTYITECGILSNLGTLVAVGKASYPLTKNNTRYLAFQLEIDF